MSSISDVNIGNDAAFMLERALEEMDDIFKSDEEQPSQSFMHTISSPRPGAQNLSPHRNSSQSNYRIVPEQSNYHGFDYSHSDGTQKAVDRIIKLYDKLEVALSNEVLMDNTGNINGHHKTVIFEHGRNLPCCLNFMEELLKCVHGSSIRRAQEQLAVVQQEKDSFLLQIGQLHDQIMFTENELEMTRKKMAEFARKNEQLLIRITEQRVAENHKLKGQVQSVNHNALLLEGEEKDGELEKLKCHIESLLDEQEKRKMPTGTAPHDVNDSVNMLKNRLREKASECNRLKITIEDLKQQQEAKDNALSKVQDEIQRLFEENERLRQQIASPNHTIVQANGSAVHHQTETEMPDSQKSNGYKSHQMLQQIKGLKSTSEPNLRHELKPTMSVGLASPAISTNTDDSIYTPYKRMISDSPFASWSCEQVQDWMRDEGLEDYTRACASCVKRGEDMLKFTTADYERQLGITDPLQQKKLNYALKAVQSNGPDYAGRLDHNWVVKWLEDLGLPQYKNVFFEHKVDGRVLMNLTIDDVLYLKIYNLLHHTSLKRAIQFLRHQKFHPQYLREVANQSDERCDHVMLWTSHRVMHWLRSVDLAEYAPNLRGSGVHGALMCLEPRFNAETLANLLSIPNNKTLLRRHVATQFETLLSESCQKQKDMTQRASEYAPLNGSEKHKARKKVLTFGSLRRRKSETSLDDLLCPLELDVSNMYSPPPALDPDLIFDMSESASLSPSLTNDNNSESTNETSGTHRTCDLSQDIEHLTNTISGETR